MIKEQAHIINSYNSYNLYNAFNAYAYICIRVCVVQNQPLDLEAAQEDIDPPMRPRAEKSLDHEAALEAWEAAQEVSVAQ
jgi:hypothetical protein